MDPVHVRTQGYVAGGDGSTKPQLPNSICRLNGYDSNGVTYVPVVIVGAGESGIAMGARLRQALGFDQFRIYDRQAGIGGTWWINRYPGVACDVPAIFYSFSFARNPKWSTWYPTGPEIVKYLHAVCAKFMITDKIQCNTRVDGCKWLADEEMWEVYLTHLAPGMGDLSQADMQAMTEKHGEHAVLLSKETIKAKVVISAVGGLVEPKKWPNHIPGTESFEGEIFHSARWRHDIDFTDKNVLVVGAGCSSAQLVPKIVKPPFNARSVTQLMRTPGWVAPRDIPPGGHKLWEKYAPTLLSTVPGLELLIRYIVIMGSEQLYQIFGGNWWNAKLRDALERDLVAHLKKTAPEKYHDILTPNYPVGCKRLVFDTWWLPSLHDPKIELTTQPLEKVNSHSVILGANSLYAGKSSSMKYEEREIPVDIIVQANGFETTRWLHPLEVIGEGGKDLVEEMAARGGPQAYQGTALDGFPNFLMIFGPNTATGHSSVILATENMVEHALQFVKLIISGDATTFDVKKEAEQEYTAMIQRDLKKTVWHSGGCQSWYFNDTNGWNSTLYPHSQLRFGLQCLFPKWSDWNIKYTTKGTVKKRLTQIAGIIALLVAITGSYRAWKSGFDISRLRNVVRSYFSNLRSTFKST